MRIQNQQQHSEIKRYDYQYKQVINSLKGMINDLLDNKKIVWKSFFAMLGVGDGSPTTVEKRLAVLKNKNPKEYNVINKLNNDKKGEILLIIVLNIDKTKHQGGLYEAEWSFIKDNLEYFFNVIRKN